MPDLTSPRFATQTFRSIRECVTARPNWSLASLYCSHVFSFLMVVCNLCWPDENYSHVMKWKTLSLIFSKVLEQRDLYYTQAESLRRSATPRPRWNKAAEHIDGKV